MTDHNITCTDLTIPTGGTLTANSSTITCSGDFTTSGGLIGKSAYTFDGSSGYINAGDSADGTYGNRNIFAGGGTVEVWFKAASHGENTAGRLIQKTRTIGSDVGWRLNMDGSNKLYFRQDFGEAAGIWKTPASTVVFGKWHHFAVTYDNGDVANNPTFYLDGKVIAAEEDNTPVGSYESDSGQAMYIGNQDHNNGNTFDGTIAMVRVFTDIRTQAEIRADMFNNKAGMSSTHLLARMYQFDEGTSTALENVADAAGSTGDATISGSAWAAAGTFTYGTSTLTLTGSSKNINYTSNENVKNLTISGSYTLNEIDGNNNRFRPDGNLNISGTLASTGNEYISMDAGGTVTLTSATLTGLYKLELAQSAVPGTVSIPACTTQRIFCTNSGGTTQATGALTITKELQIEGTFNANGQTIAVKEVDLQSGGTLNLSSSTLLFNVTSTDDALGLHADSTLTTGNTTITGYASATKTPATLPAAGGFEVVGDVKWLDIQSGGDLTVIGAVTACSMADSTANIRQWHHTLDTQQLLDADSGGDDDLKLERPALDNALELMTG